MAGRTRVLNINRGTRIKAGLTLQDMMLLFMVGLLSFIMLSPLLPNTLLRFVFSAGSAYGALRVNSYVKERHGPGFLQEYLLFVFSPDVFGPAEDPHPTSVLAQNDEKEKADA